ncbi:MAG: hypothetical protein WCT33_02735 [Patescibacteria group bacterium]
MKRRIIFSIFAVIFVVATSVVFGLPQVSLAGITDGKILAQEDIYIDSDQTINDNFIGFGENIEINGPVNGDIIVAGTNITINSTVQGDVIAAGNTISIRGEVLGNVRVVGNTVDLDAMIGKNTNVAAKSFSTSLNNSIGWSLSYLSETANIKGLVGGHVDGSATSYISATIGGNVNIYANQENGKITLTDKAIIKGNFTYSSVNDPTVSDNAVIQGDIIKKAPAIQPFDKSDFFKFIGLTTAFFKITGLFGLFIVGMIIVSILKKDSIRIIDQMKNEPAKSMGWGLALLILTPIVCTILVITIIGAPLAMITMAIYMIIAYVSKVFVGLLIGRWIILGIRKQKKDKSFSLLLAMIIGIIILSIFTSIPVLGWIINAIAVIWAFGALVQIKKIQLAESNK